MNLMDRMVGLRDSEMMKLADVILAKQISIKSNKPSGGQQRERISLQDWCQIRKRMRFVMNEPMAEFWNKELSF